MTELAVIAIGALGTAFGLLAATMAAAKIRQFNATYVAMVEFDGNWANDEGMRNQRP